VESEAVVRQATPAQAERVGSLVYELLSELYPELGYAREKCIAVAGKLLAGCESVWSFLATTRDDRDVGVIMLNECAAIYSGGPFGEISELYVVPEFRSKGVGAQLIEAAVTLGRERGWPDIEVGAPSVPAWQRTVDFYLGCGFEEVGPRLDLRIRSSG
jgi:GNAT superfamily N-acetyltransferase